MPSIPGVSSLFGEKQAPPMPGHRISVLSSGDTTAATATVEAKEPVLLPEPRANASWSQPGGVASNAPGHLAFSGTGRRLWRGDAGSGSSSSGRITAIPIVVNGKVFTLDRKGRVTAFSMNGSELWNVSLRPEDEKSSSGYGGGLAAEGDRIYAASGFGTVTALSTSGKLLWTKKLGVPIRSSPTASGGKVFVVNTESQLFALNGADGSEVWSMRGLPEGAEILSNVSPAVSGNVAVVSFSSGEVMALDANSGQQKWVDSVSSRGAATTITSIGEAARPVIANDIVFASSQSGRLIATAIRSGERVWSRDIRSDQTPAVAGDTVFVVDTGGRLYALARKTGKVRWVTPLPKARMWTGPALAGGKLWVISNNGLMVAVDARSGQIAGKADLDTSVYIPPVVASGRMFVLTDKARLVAMN
jgi:outer membrane protein assembly factor BamB